MPSLWSAILFFIKTGCLSIGGGYAAIQMIQVQLVDVWQMMTMEDFNTLFVIAETTPGPLTINAATFVGCRLAGVPGGIVCTLSYIFPTVLICVALSYVYGRLRGGAVVQRVLSFLRPAVIALIVATTFDQLSTALFGTTLRKLSIYGFKPLHFVLFVAAYALLKRKKLPPWAVILGCGALGTALSLLTGGVFGA